jgi:hypothetical protein
MAVKRAAPETYLFVRTGFDVAALIRYQRMMEDFIADLPNQADTWVADESSNAATILLYDGVLRSMLPSVLRSSFLSSLWSLYESTILEIAVFSGAQLTLPALRVRDQGGFNNATTAYYRDVLGFPREPDAAAQAELEVLYKLRNAIMHGGGRKGSVEPNKWRELQALAARRGDFDLSTGAIVPSDGLIHSMMYLVSDSLKGLVQRARSRLADVA